MKRVRVLETRTLYAGAGVSLHDDHTGGAPLGEVAIDLDIEEAPNQFRPTRLRPVWNGTSAATWPWLELRRDARGAAPRKYRARVHAELYAPFYLLHSPGLELTVFPFDDDLPPAQLTAAPTPVVLLPGAAYPFAANVPVLHGVVEDAGGQRQPFALVSSKSDRVLTDEDGAFSLPMRRAPIGQPTPIDAEDRQGRTGARSVTLPQALATSQTIIVT